MVHINYIIGDIHGCYDQLLALEEKIYRECSPKEHPLFISVGDLIDRGPKNPEVIDAFIQGSKNGTHRAVLGNHEEEFLRIIEAFHPQIFEQDLKWPFFLRRLQDDWNITSHMESFEAYCIRMKKSWYEQGGYQTIESYGLHPEHPERWFFPLSHLQYITDLPLFLEEEHLLVSHGLMTREDWELLSFYELGQEAYMRQKKHTELKSPLKVAVQRTLWNRKLPSRPVHEDKIHISGHTPSAELRSYHDRKTIQVDLGCVYGGDLAAYGVPKESVYCVKGYKNPSSRYGVM